MNEYTAYLGGDILISGDRGYYSRAFYIWVMDADEEIVLAAGFVGIISEHRQSR